MTILATSSRLDLGTRWAMRIRRTCPRCGQVGRQIVRNGRCGQCAEHELDRAAELAARTCGCCGRLGRGPYRRDGGYPYAPLCGPCYPAVARRRRQERAAAIEHRRARALELRDLRMWAAAALADPDLRVLDTETTGLGAEARIVEVAVLDGAGRVLLESLLDPGEPIPPEATAIHGITDAMVAGRPAFAEILPALTAALAGRRVLIYNARFDTQRLAHEVASCQHGGPARREAAAESWLAGFTAEDAMAPYSAWVGEVDELRGGYRRQRLGGAHRAVGDCAAVLDLLDLMAGIRRTAAVKGVRPG